MVQVITLWEPLKPFIAILVEVVVLVAAILLYERSLAKKKCSAGKSDTKRHTSCFLSVLNTVIYFNLKLIICLFLRKWDKCGTIKHTVSTV